MYPLVSQEAQLPSADPKGDYHLGTKVFDPVDWLWAALHLPTVVIVSSQRVRSPAAYGVKQQLGVSSSH